MINPLVIFQRGAVRRRVTLLALALAAVTLASVFAVGRAAATVTVVQPDTVPPPVPREFRGVWVATVANIDWPSRPGLPVPQQQAELLRILDRSAELNLNAVIFQVRPAADALYASTIEPWSEYLTGAQGQAPRPAWDPLEFAVREAHVRGLELHAWFNPYRAQNERPRSALAANHIARTDPSLVKKYGGFLWMDPGEPLIRRRTLRVVLDVVKRYDIDGVHIDDYFYPYPIAQRRGELPFPDDASWAKYKAARGTLSRDDWRRDNVNTLVRELAEGIRETKPWVKFGISPFGIWRPGSPPSVRGLDAYSKLYADAKKWMQEGWGDYFSPQLYWPTYKEGQKYGALLEWWAKENTQRRHLWPGNFTSRAGATGAGSFPVSELVDQIQATRVHPGAGGNVHFSMRSFVRNQADMNDSLRQGAYRLPALVPASPWMSAPPPPRPRVSLGRDRDGVRTVELQTVSGERPWLWTVRVLDSNGWTTYVLPGARTRWSASPGSDPREVVVTAVNRIGEERGP